MVAPVVSIRSSIPSLEANIAKVYLSQLQQHMPLSKFQYPVFSRVRPVPNLSKTGNKLLGPCQRSDFSGKVPPDKSMENIGPSPTTFLFEMFALNSPLVLA